MPAATAVLAPDRPTGHMFSGTFTLDPASIAAAGRELETVAIPQIQATDVVSVSPQAALTAGLVVGYARPVAGVGIEFSIENNSGGAVDQASGTWNFCILRGSTMALR
jgi:hypothetical protein